ncbi:MAG: ArsR/SmtB family transcription factor [Bacillota bacterium]
MKFKFDENSSRIYDFILFPRAYFIKDLMEKEDNGVELELMKEEYLIFANEIKHDLEPYKNEILKYYSKDLYSDFEFVDFITKAYPVEGYKDEQEYLKTLSDIPEEEFNKKIIHTILTYNNDEDEENSKNDDDNQIYDTSDSIELINDLNIESNYKWNLLMMIQNPKKYFNEYREFLNQLTILFNKVYNKHKDNVKKVGNYLVDKLKDNPNESFKELTYNSIDYDFTEEEPCIIFVSAIFPYTLRLIQAKDKAKFIWGMYMEESFRTMNKFYEDRLVQRVKIFKALGDKTRYETIKLIASGISSIKEIAKELDVSSATISYHINEFLTSGIVSLNKKNRKSGYKIDYERLKEVIEALKEDLVFPKSEE